MEKTFSDTTDAFEFYNWCKTYSYISSNECSAPIDGIVLADLRLNDRKKEDKIFRENDDIRENLRRGHCVLKYTDSKNTEHYSFARKGLNKFFDYRLVTKNQESKTEQEKLMAPILNSLNSGNRIVTYITHKENGENAQIAYEPNTNGWVLASKNVTILVRNRDDIKYYKETAPNNSRFEFAVIFANLWFDNIDKYFGDESKLDEFKKDITGYTLVCECVGDVNHQHIKLYKEHSFIFYGMVRNNSLDISIPILESRRILKEKYGLNYVEIQQSPYFNTLDEFSNYMKDVYNTVLTQDVLIGGEGCVAYFCEVDNNNSERVLSLAKLKTFEYRFLRKIREIIRNIKFNKSTNDALIEKIKKESLEILGEDGDDLDLTEWLKFAKFIMSFVRRTTELVSYPDYYATFILDMKTLYDSMELVTDEIVDSISKKFKAVYKKPEEIKIVESTNYNITKYTFSKGKIYIFACLGLVASGKSTLFSTLLSNESYSDKINMSYISSDKIRSELVDKYLLSKPGSTFDEAFDAVGKQAKSAFDTKFFELVKYADKTTINIILVDKNFPGSSIKYLTKETKRTDITIYAFHPKTFYPINERGLKYPFSWSYFIQCYHRLKYRSNHENLDFNKNPYAHHILLCFMDANKNLLEYRFDRKDNIHRHPLSFAEEKQIELPEEAYTLWRLIFDGLKTFDLEKLKERADIIDQFFQIIENLYPMDSFGSTLLDLEKEIEIFMHAKIYGKLPENTNDDDC